jgi:hypothetical protein
MDGPAIRRAIEDGLLPRDTPQRLDDNHPYWEFSRAAARREAAAAGRVAGRGAPAGKPGPPPLSRAQAGYLESNAEALSTCVIPTVIEVQGAAALLREAAAALSSAIETCRRIADAPWPTGCWEVDEHLADRFEDLLSTERVGACWIITDLR